MIEIKSDDEKTSGSSKQFELITAITLAILAAMLAITDLGASKYGDDEIMGTNEKSNVYGWYQSKSIKQSLVEGQRDLLETLVESGSIRQEQVASLKNFMARLDEDITRYKKEKKELLLGSAAIGKENWIQDVDGELGKITGAKEWEAKLALLSRAGDKFDLGSLFLQLCLVVGAVSLVLHDAKLKYAFYAAMVLLGVVGSACSVQAFLLAMQVG